MKARNNMEGITMENRNERLARITKELGRDTLPLTLRQQQIDLDIEYIKIENSLDDLELEMDRFLKGAYVQQ